MAYNAQSVARAVITYSEFCLLWLWLEYSFSALCELILHCVSSVMRLSSVVWVIKLRCIYQYCVVSFDWDVCTTLAVLSRLTVLSGCDCGWQCGLYGHLEIAQCRRRTAYWAGQVQEEKHKCSADLPSEHPAIWWLASDAASCINSNYLQCVLLAFCCLIVTCDWALTTFDC